MGKENQRSKATGYHRVDHSKQVSLGRLMGSCYPAAAGWGYPSSGADLALTGCWGFFINQMTKYYLYILYSSQIDQYYIGISHNPEKRLTYHNSAPKRWIRRGRSWTIVFQKEFQIQYVIKLINFMAR
jgi:hypothetical protein